MRKKMMKVTFGSLYMGEVFQFDGVLYKKVAWDTAFGNEKNSSFFSWADVEVMR